jgi:c-di-GMP-binding flagellar brake protein YcgR
MEIEDRRRYPRYSIYCPIEYRCEDGGPLDASITLNLCEGGALITTPRYIGPSSRIIIRITLKGRVFFVRARVVHVSAAQHSDVYNTGVEFLQSPFDFVRRMYEQIETIMLFQMQYSREAARPVTLAEASMKWFGAPGPDPG